VTAERLSRLDAALDYVRRGWPVIPLHTVDERGRCTCGDAACDSPGKHPLSQLVPNGLKNATLDQELVRLWFDRSPEPNAGVATGRRGCGWLVIDVDVKGAADWHELERQHALPATIEQLTGGGGRQLIFRRPGMFDVPALGNATGNLPDGVDVRCDGGYVVVPPSLHASGRRYEWSVDGHPDEVQAVRPPGWLLDVICADAGEREPLHLEPEQIIPEGKRNRTLTRYGGAMRRYGLPEAAIRAALLEVNRLHCKPPLPHRDVAGVARSVAHYRPTEPILTQPATLAAVASSRLVIGADEVQSRAIRWLWIGRLPFGYLVVQTGIEGLGKSAFAAWMIAEVTRGELPGELERVPSTVLIVAAEDGIADTWKPRLALVGADMARVKFLDLDELGDDWNIRDGIDAIAEAAAGCCARLLFVDALLDHMPDPKSGESINSPTFVRAALSPLKRLARRQDMAALYSMHPPKGRSVDFRDMVQASQAFAAVPRTGLLFAYHPDDHDKPEQERRRVLLRGKGNIGRDPGALEFRIEGTPYRHEGRRGLGNTAALQRLRRSGKLARIR
jgi:Bifunctional DNA primase/polymerase, N-terminal/AAA domain/Primase C terminal 1 (PriCT-1)